MKRKMQLERGQRKKETAREVSTARSGPPVAGPCEAGANSTQYGNSAPHIKKTRTTTGTTDPACTAQMPGGAGESLVLVLHRELVRKLYLSAQKNKLKIIVDGSVNLCLVRPTTRCPMPNSHSPDKEPLSLQIPRTLMGRLRKLARKQGVKLPHLVTTILTSQTNDIVLTSKDYEAIARATQKAERTGKRCKTEFADPA